MKHLSYVLPALATFFWVSDTLANECFWELDPIRDNASTAGKSSGHQDLGNGTVFSAETGGDPYTLTIASSFTVQLCASGQYLSVVYRGACIGDGNPDCHRVGLDGEGSFEVDPKPIKKAIIDLTRSTQKYSWEEFIRKLEDLGARPQKPVTSDFESCACAVFYPELKGDKRPNKVRDADKKPIRQRFFDQ